MKVVVIGLGVVGGSIIKALKGNEKYEVYGVDTDVETLKQATEEGCIIKGFTDANDILPESDFTIICLYPSIILEFLQTHTFKPGSIVTDVVGIKSYFLEKALKIIPDNVEYISVHPMAGREKQGYAYADGDVFKGANFIIIQHEKNHAKQIKFMQEFAKELGFNPAKIMSPYDHDEIIAFTSQLSHVIAVSLINSDDNKFDTGKYVGDSYRDLTRIANINEDLWTELFLNNKKYLLQAVNRFEKSFDIMKEAIETDDADTLKKLFIEGTRRRELL